MCACVLLEVGIDDILQSGASTGWRPSRRCKYKRVHDVSVCVFACVCV